MFYLQVIHLVTQKKVFYVDSHTMQFQ